MVGGWGWIHRLTKAQSSLKPLLGPWLRNSHNAMEAKRMEKLLGWKKGDNCREDFIKEEILSYSLCMREISAEGNTMCRVINVEMAESFGEGQTSLTADDV